MSRLPICLCLLVVALSCTRPVPNYPYAKEPDPRKSEYVIGVPDELRIRVWRMDDLNSDVQVRPDGTITLPLIGDVRAADRTPTQLKDEVTQRLAAYVKTGDSAVTVEVTRINSYRVTVAGNVSQPGVLQSPRYLTVSEAVTLAGGPNRFADADQTVIIRARKNGTVVRIPIQYDLLMQGRGLEQDIVLLSGDQIFVP